MMKNFITWAISTSIKILRMFGGSVHWSSLRSLGRSGPMRLTVLTPFLGSLILLDNRISDIISKSNTGIGHFNALTLFIAEKISNLNATNLYIFYIGLSCLGFGSIVFAWKCPNQIKAASDSTQYVSQERPFFSPVLSGNIFSKIANIFQEVERARNPFYREYLEISMPQQTAQRFGDLINQVYQADPRGFDPDSGVVTMTDNLNFDVVVQSLSSRARVSRAVWQMFDRLPSEFEPDILRLDYEIEDSSRTLWRALICALYVIGFSLLSIPTLKTFLTVAGLLTRTAIAALGI